jgi:hypothetical protein
MQRMANHGIESYLTGCLTLSLGSHVESVPPEEREGVYFVDLSEEVEALLPADLRDRAVRLTNYLPQEMLFDPLERMVYAARQNDMLRRAECVFTNRLHVALPCVGYRTPVQVLVRGKESQRHRFSGFEEYVPVVYFGEQADCQSADIGAIQEPPRIPEPLDRAFAALKDQLSQRLGRCEFPRYQDLYRRDEVVIPNPGLGPEPGVVGIDLGMRIVERSPTFWDAKRIVLGLECYASFERSRFPVLVGRPRKIGPRRFVRWHAAGVVENLMSS